MAESSSGLGAGKELEGGQSEDPGAEDMGRSEELGAVEADENTIASAAPLGTRNWIGRGRLGGVQAEVGLRRAAPPKEMVVG